MSILYRIRIWFFARWIFEDNRPGTSKDLYSRLSNYKQVSEVMRTAGPANFILTVCVRDIAELTRFITGELERLEGVERIETMFVLPEEGE